MTQMPSPCTGWPQWVPCWWFTLVLTTCHVHISQLAHWAIVIYMYTNDPEEYCNLKIQLKSSGFPKLENNNKIWNLTWVGQPYILYFKFSPSIDAFKNWTAMKEKIWKWKNNFLFKKTLKYTILFVSLCCCCCCCCCCCRRRRRRRVVVVAVVFPSAAAAAVSVFVQVILGLWFSFSSVLMLLLSLRFFFVFLVLSFFLFWYLVWQCISAVAGKFSRLSSFIIVMAVSFKAGPPWFEFLVSFDFFALWCRKSRRASCVKIA